MRGKVDAQKTDNSGELLYEFLHMVKEKYPDLNISFEHLREIVYSPFVMLKEVMESGEMESMRMKYFGIFEARANTLNKYKNYLKAGKITQEEYNKQEKIAEKILKNNKK